MAEAASTKTPWSDLLPKKKKEEKTPWADLLKKPADAPSPFPQPLVSGGKLTAQEVEELTGMTPGQLMSEGLMTGDVKEPDAPPLKLEDLTPAQRRIYRLQLRHERGVAPVPTSETGEIVYGQAEPDLAGLRKQLRIEGAGAEPRRKAEWWEKNVKKPVREMREQAAEMGPIGGMIAGGTQGARVGRPILGGVLGGIGGAILSNPIFRGRAATLPEMGEAGVWGALPGGQAFKPSLSRIKNVLRGAGEVGTVAAGAAQTREILETGKPLSAKETVKHAAVPAVIGGALGAMGKAPKEPQFLSKKEQNLADTYEVFKALGEKPPPSIIKRIKESGDDLRTILLARARPVEVGERQIYDYYKKELPKLDMAAQLEQLAGSPGRAEAAVHPFRKEVMKPIHRLAGPVGKFFPSLQKKMRDDFSTYMFLKRTVDRLQSAERTAAEIKESSTLLKKLKRLRPTKKRAAEIGELEFKLTGLRARSGKEVAEFTIKEAQTQLKTLEGKLGADRFSQLAEIGEKYQLHADTALKRQVESGRISQKTYDNIRADNDFYAPFRLLEYADKPWQLKAIKGIKRKELPKMKDMVSALDEVIWTTNLMADRNEFLLKFKRLADMDKERIFIQKIKESTKVPEGFDKIMVLEKGQPFYYQVKSEIAEPIKFFQGEKDELVKMLGKYSAIPKAGMTMYNVRFQIGNLLSADLPTAATLSDMGIYMGGKRSPFPKEIPILPTTGIPGIVKPGQLNIPMPKLGPKGEKAYQALTRIVDPMIFGIDLVKSLSSAGKAKFGVYDARFMNTLKAGNMRNTIQAMLTPEAITGYKPLGKSTFNVFKKVGDLSNAVEEAFAIQGVMRAMRKRGMKDVEAWRRKFPEDVTEIRRLHGSPDFNKLGRGLPEYGLSMQRANLLYFFLNARIQGQVRDLERMGNVTNTKKWLYAMGRMGATVGTATALNHLHNKENYAEDLAKVPQWEKDNYWIFFRPNFIPNPSNPDEMVRDRDLFQKRESAKLMANSVEFAIDQMKDDDPQSYGDFLGNVAEMISPINIEGDTPKERLDSALAGFNPLVRGPAEVFFNRKLWQHRPIMSEQAKKRFPELQVTSRTRPVFEDLAHEVSRKTGGKYNDTLGVPIGGKAPSWLRSPADLEHLADSVTGGLFTQFAQKPEVVGRDDWRNSWFMRTVGSRFLTAGYAVQDKELEKKRREAEKWAASLAHARQQEVKKFKELGRKAEWSDETILKEFIKRHPMEPGEVTKENLVNMGQVERMMASIKVEMLRGSPGWDIKSLGNYPPEQRAELIMHMAEQLPMLDDQATARGDFIQKLVQEKWINPKTMMWMGLLNKERINAGKKGMLPPEMMERMFPKQKEEE